MQTTTERYDRHPDPQPDQRRGMQPRRKRWLATATMALGLLCGGESAKAAGLLIADGGFGGVLEIKQHDVRVTINNGIAVTEVTQVFTNTENRIVEALYTFPVPNGASVANFSMWIGGKEMVGEVVEKKRAREIYESYKQTRRDPGLLEQVDYKRFEMRIFPIAAGAEQKVKIEYYQELDFDHDQASYIYPLSTVTRADIKQETAGKLSFRLDVKSEIPIVSMESPSHGDDIVIARHDPHYHQASLEVASGSLANDLVLDYQIERPRTGIDVLTSKESSEPGYVMLTLTAGKELAEQQNGMDYVFVLDVSGSMAHDGKLSISRGAIGAFLEGLGPKDRFEVVTFNIAPSPLFGALTTPDEVAAKRVKEALEAQRARGGTELLSALQVAYNYRDDDRVLNVVLLSDGLTEQKQQTELVQLINGRPHGSRVFCIGVGNEVNRPLLGQLADNAGGLSAFLSQKSNFAREAESFRRKLIRPAATNVRISFEGGGVQEIEPEALPNLFHGEPIRLYARYSQPGLVKVTIDAEIQGAPLHQTVAITLPETDDKNPEIERMWAWHRVQRLLDKARADGSISQVQSEIVDLCETYSIVSEYASFIVLENDEEYRRWKIDRRNVSRVARDRQARAVVQDQLDELKARAAAAMGPQEPPANERRTSEAIASARRTESPASPSNSPEPQPQPTSNRERSVDIDVPNSNGGGNSDRGGGGAIDPITGLLSLGFAGAAALASLRRKEQAKK